MNGKVGKRIINPIRKRLNEPRIAVGVSQKKLGIAAGIDAFSSSARMNQYETGKHMPGYSTLSKIAKILKAPTAFFYSKDDNLAELIKLYNYLDILNLQKILSIVKKITTVK